MVSPAVEELTWPQISQHALRGQGLSMDMFVPAGGVGVPGTVGPQKALATAAGIGGVPVLRQITIPTNRSSQPFQDQVSALYSVNSSAVMLFAAAMDEQVSPLLTVYEAQDPSELGCGAKSGSVPSEQQIYSAGWRSLQKLGSEGLYSESSSWVIPHFCDKE